MFVSEWKVNSDSVLRLTSCPKFTGYGSFDGLVNICVIKNDKRCVSTGLDSHPEGQSGLSRRSTFGLAYFFKVPDAYPANILATRVLPVNEIFLTTVQD